jgi:hypothetical protein
VTIPPQARVMDASGKTIIPGIVDIHSHWGALRSELLEPEAPQPYANLAFGVTTIRDPQTPRTFSPMRIWRNSVKHRARGSSRPDPAFSRTQISSHWMMPERPSAAIGMSMALTF